MVGREENDVGDVLAGTEMLKVELSELGLAELDRLELTFSKPKFPFLEREGAVPD